MTAVLGAIGTFAAWSRSSRCTPRRARSASPGWSLGMGGYYVYRRARASTCEDVLQDRPPRAPAGLRGARVPHGARADLRRRRQRLGAAERREADRRGGRRLRDLRAARAEPALARGGPRGGGGARALGARERADPGRRAGIKIHTGLIRTRNPGAALVEEAERVGSDVIYWSTIHAPAGEQRIGPTAAYLLSKRPCRVIIETENRPGAPHFPPARASRRRAQPPRPPSSAPRRDRGGGTRIPARAAWREPRARPS
jgi:hypothetical protein